MKKFVCYLLVAVMLVATLATSAFAAQAGETVTVAVSAEGNPGFGAYKVALSYDKAALELVAMNGDALSAGGSVDVNLEAASVAFIKATDVTGDGVLFTATFKISEEAANGVYEIGATLVEAYNNNLDEVTFTVKAEAVEVANPHVCVFGEWVVEKEPTCIETGLKARYCECGAKETEEIPVIAHAWGAWYGLDDYYHCRECSVVPHDKQKEAHEWDETGLKCTVCGWEKDPTLDPVPGTGDITPVVVTSAFALIALVALAGYMLKRKFAL